MAQKEKKGKKKINKNKLILLCTLAGLLLIILLFAGWFFFLTRGSATISGAVKGYFKAIEKKDADAYIRNCYPSAWSDNYHPQGNDVVLEGLVEDVFLRQSGTTVKDIEITHEEELEDVFVKRIQDKIKELYDVDLSISRVCRVYFKMKISYMSKGEEVQYDSEVKTRYVYKYHGKWYYLADTLLLVDMALDDQ